MIIGIYGLGSQSGLAYFADMVNRGYTVIGYNRPSINGNSVINVINKQGGVYLERPENSNNERSHFIPLDQSQVTNDLNILVEQSYIIIITLPSIYQVASVE